MGLIVDLEEQSVLTAHINMLYLRFLLDRIGIIIAILIIQHSKYGISGMMIEDNR